MSPPREPPSPYRRSVNATVMGNKEQRAALVILTKQRKAVNRFPRFKSPGF